MGNTGWNAARAAEQVLRDLAEQELAFVWREAEARASDAPWPNQPKKIDPHVLEEARYRLLKDGLLTWDKSPTRGGAEIRTWSPADTRGRQQDINIAAARKRLLYARYLGWAEGNATFRRGLIGPAAEGVFHDTLREVSPSIGYRIENPDGGNTDQVLGTLVMGGAVDNAFHAYLGNPPELHTFVVEVKSRREYIYHETEQLYQVLHKAAMLQLALPSSKIVPVLVARRAHLTAFRLMDDVGGFIIQTRRQWINPHARLDEEHLAEVRAELSFLDLVPRKTNPIDKYVARYLLETLPTIGIRQADRWRRSGCYLVDEYQRLWNGDSLHHLARVRARISEEDWFGGGW